MYMINELITINYKLKILFPKTHSYIIYSINLVCGLKFVSVECYLENEVKVS